MSSRATVGGAGPRYGRRRRRSAAARDVSTRGVDTRPWHTPWPDVLCGAPSIPLPLLRACPDGPCGIGSRIPGCLTGVRDIAAFWAAVQVPSGATAFGAVSDTRIRMLILANKGFEGKEPEDVPHSVHHLARPVKKVDLEMFKQTRGHLGEGKRGEEVRASFVGVQGFAEDERGRG